MSSDEYDEEQQYEHDYGTLSRTSLSTSISSRKFAGIKDIPNLIDQFKLRVQATAEEFASVRGCLSASDVHSIIEHIDDLPYIQYKNPKGYVLGYIGSNAGKAVNKKSIQKAIQCRDNLPQNVFNEDLVVNEDIIKYAYYWLNTVKKN